MEAERTQHTAGKCASHPPLNLPRQPRDGAASAPAQVLSSVLLMMSFHLQSFRDKFAFPSFSLPNAHFHRNRRLLSSRVAPALMTRQHCSVSDVARSPLSFAMAAPHLSDLARGPRCTLIAPQYHLTVRPANCNFARYRRPQGFVGFVVTRALLRNFTRGARADWRRDSTTVQVSACVYLQQVLCRSVQTAV